jgi:hypothetical protein
MMVSTPATFRIVQVRRVFSFWRQVDANVGQRVEVFMTSVRAAL